METKERKQDIFIFAVCAAILVMLAASIVMMNYSNYTLRTISFVLILLVSFVTPANKLLVIISLLFPITEIIKLSDDSRTVLPFVILVYIIKIIISRKFNLNRLILFSIPFLLFVSINIINSYARFNTITSPLVTCAFILFAFFMSSQPKNDKTNHQIAVAFILGSALAAIGSVMFKNVAIDISTVNEYSTRLGGFSSPWNFGLCMLISWFFIMYIFKNKKIGYILAIVGSAFFVYFAGQTGTRSLLAGMGTVVVYSVYAVGKRFRKINFYMVLIVLLIPVFVLIYWIFMVEPMLESRGNLYDYSRVELWTYYLNYFTSNKNVLFFGIGCNELSLYAQNNSILTAHNVFIEMFVELGIVGVILFIAMIAFIIHRAEKNPFKNNMLFLVLIYGFFLLTQSGLSTELLYFIIAIAAQSYPTKTTGNNMEIENY